jgi:hypothetical protein
VTEHWTERVARRFMVTPVSLEDYAEQFPLELVDLIDRAQGRPTRTLEQHHAAYVGRCADLYQAAEQSAAVLAQRRANTAALAVLEALEAEPAPVLPEPEPLEHALPRLALVRRRPALPPDGTYSYI